MIRRPPRSTQSRSSAASDVYKRQDVFSGGYAADAGRATGGVTSVHTRSGGDWWKISANSFFPRIRFANGSVHGVDSWEPNVGASGPIVRGRLFVEGAVSYRYDRNRYCLLYPSDAPEE